MKKLIALSLPFLLSSFLYPVSLISMGVHAEAEQTLDADSLREKTRLRGRRFQNGGNIIMDWSTSGIEFVGENLTSVKARFVTTQARIAFEVDGKETLQTVHTGDEIVIASDLDDLVPHTIKIYKASEAGGGLCELESITVNEGATIYKTKEKQYRFAFLGDSITCANQITHVGNGDIEFIDAYGGYARILSDLYDADIESTCVSGRGLMEGFNMENNWAASQQNELKDLFFEEDHFRDGGTKKYDPLSYVPDVFVVNTGSNDLGTAVMATFNTTFDIYASTLKEFHHKVREFYPNAYMVYGYGAYQNHRFQDEYRALIESLKEEDGLTCYVPFPQFGGGKDSHPSYYQHEQMANLIAKELSSSFGLEPLKPLDPLALRVEAEDCSILPENSLYRKNGNILFSKDSYIGEMGPIHEISDASQVNTTNVKILSKEVEVEKEADYLFRLGYSTSTANTDAFVRIDNEPYQKLHLPTTGGSDHVYETDDLVFHLSKGKHVVEFTSAIKSGTWANYDYFELREAHPAYYGVEYAENGEVSISGPRFVEEGEDLLLKLSPLDEEKELLSAKINISGFFARDRGNNEYSLNYIDDFSTVLVSEVSLKDKAQTAPQEKGTNLPLIIGLSVGGGAIVLLGIFAIVFFKAKKKPKA